MRIHAVLKGYWSRWAGGRDSPESKASRFYLLRAILALPPTRKIIRLFKCLRRRVGIREQTVRANKRFFVLRAGNEVLTF